MSTDDEQLRGRVLRTNEPNSTVEVVNVELPRRIKINLEMPSSEAIREASIYRTSQEQGIPLEEAEVIYDRLLDRIHRALNNS